MGETAHKGDPCFYCNTPHDEVLKGPCPGRALYPWGHPKQLGRQHRLCAMPGTATLFKDVEDRAAYMVAFNGGEPLPPAPGDEP